MTATQGDKTLSTVTDADGHYAFPLLDPGTWNITIDMFGFETLKKDVDFAAANGAINFDLTLKPSQVLQRLQQFAARRNGAGAPAGPTGGSGSRAGRAGQGAPGNRSSNNPGQNADLDQQLQAELNGDSQNAAIPQGSNENANDSFLISGSLSPGMTQGAQADSGPDMRYIGGGAPGMMGAAGPNGDMSQTGGVAPGGGFGPAGPGGGGPGGGGGFGGRGGGGGGGFGGRGRPGQRRPGQVAGATFGNRRRQQNQIHGQASFTLANSALNAKPFSLNGLDIPQQSYAQSRFSFILNGPLLKFKPFKDTKTNFFITYFGTRARNPDLFTETVPTALQRNGDFSQTTQSLGGANGNVPVAIYDPLSSTRTQFPNNVIPTTLISPVALKLLSFYPLPNEPSNANNYQTDTTNIANSDNLGLRIQRNLTDKDRVFLNLQYQHRDGTTAQPFGYADTTSGYGLNTQLQWTRNISAQAISTLGVRFNRNYSNITPFFSTVPNLVSLPGASTNPLDYGPPTLTFTNFSSLSDSNPTLNRNQTFNPTEAISLLKGLHSLQFGGGYTRADLSSRTDPNARGTFSFTGEATSLLSSSGTAVTGSGYDLADFLLGMPQSTSIAYSEQDHYFLQNQFYLYAQDEWKPKANLTLILGVRYDYFSPLHEKYGRLANLDIAPDFTNVAIVTPNIPGPYTGAFPSGLINPDWNNFSPRLALAYKVPTKKSTLIRAGYGIYYQGQAYNPFANSLANQPPFATSLSANTSVEQPLTIAQGFAVATPSEITNNFAVARNYRTPYAGTWNATIQRDLGRGFFVELGYLGTKGTGLDVRIVPNQQPPGSVVQTTQVGRALAFIYDESVGNSIFEAGHFRLIRRFNHGLSINAFYQYAKSIDDSSTFGGAGNTTAQNWQDISAERGLSSFDIRHQFLGSFIYTSPVGAAGSRIATDSKLGHALANWTLSGSMTAQTGQPLTARVLGNQAQLAQTTGTGSGRAEATGESIESGTGFFNLNAFTVPLTAEYGNAGRNTIPGPGLFNLNLAFGRSFSLGERRRSIDFRFETNNVLNHVNYTGYYTVVNAVNYGLPSGAGATRTLDVVVRLRF